MVDLYEEYQVDITSPSQLENWKLKLLNHSLFDPEVKEEISDHGLNRHVFLKLNQEDSHPITPFWLLELREVC